MNGMKQKDFSDRLSVARDAKQAMVAKLRQRPGPDDPAIVERWAARAAVSAARDARVAEREAQRVAKSARLAADHKALAAEQAEADKRATAEKAESEARLEFERKAARDARTRPAKHGSSGLHPPVSYDET